MTAPVIELEFDDFARAARSVFGDVGDPLAAAASRAVGRLRGGGGMAGDDPAGRDWAAAYDRAAGSTLRASQDAINACYKVASMLGRTAANYAAADAASTPGGRAGHPGWVGVDDCLIGLPTDLPTAAGGSGGTPGHWGMIAHLVGYVWPDGSQGRLREAASAWRACGDAFSLHSEYLPMAALPATAHRLPESADIRTVCRSLYDHVRGVAQAQSAMAEACEELAHHLDVVHSEVEHEIGSLIAWTVGIEATGGLLSVVTAGLAEAPTQAVEAARIARTAAKVAQLIEKFIALARTAAASVAAVVERAEAAAARFRVILSVRLEVASVSVARRVQIVRSSGEFGAIGRLGDGGDGFAFRYIDDPKLFDPNGLQGLSEGEVRAGIPRTWRSRPSGNGAGEVFEDPLHRGRQIRIMHGYPPGTRPDPITSGPYAVISQAGRKPIKVALAGNPTLR